MQDSERGAQWRNRIIETGAAHPDELAANPLNWRTHPHGQRAALEAALDGIGWIQDVIVNRRTGQLLDGHLRVELARQRGEKAVPVKYVDLSPDEEKLALATFDPIGALAGADMGVLVELLEGIDTDDEALNDLLDGLAQSAGLDDEPGDEDEDYGEANGGGRERSDGSLLKLVNVTVAEPTHVAHRGDVWRMGKHVLVVADVLTEWSAWVQYLDEEDTIFAPYPGPFVPMAERMHGKRIVLVQPDLYIAGHILDRYAELHGAPQKVASAHD